MPTHIVYGRRVKNPGAPPKRTKRSAYAYLPGSEHYSVADGVVGKPTDPLGASVVGHTYFNKRLKLRTLKCGH